jgi:hypothetical protein
MDDPMDFEASEEASGAPRTPLRSHITTDPLPTRAGAATPPNRRI